MTALAIATRAAYPLGKPADRDRYGMTAEQAFVYNWLVRNRPHTRPFAISFRHVGQLMASTQGNIHTRVTALVERGWLERDDAGYKFVQPIMWFNPKKGK
jgi:DNA-binding MarR family transcriptional regulator